MILNSSATGPTGYAIYLTNYVGGKVASGATIQNLTIQGSIGGIQIQDFTESPAQRLTDITIKDVVINTVPGTTCASQAGGCGFMGIFAQSADRVNIDNVTITSEGNGIELYDTTTSLVMNSTVTHAFNEGGAGLAMIGGTGNVIVNNTFGSPKSGSTYSFNTGGVIFYNTTANRFENNVVQGMRDDGLDYTAVDGFGLAPAARSTDNYAGKNTVISTGFADGRAGGSGIWSNCGSTGSWMYANDSQGSVECGLCVFTAVSNMVLGNVLHNNGIAGVVLSGGSETHPFCTAASNTFQDRPTNNFIQSNSAYYNRNDQFNVRDADSTEIDRNVLFPRNGFGGALRSDCQSQFCQSAFTADANISGSNGLRIAANTSDGNIRGFQSDTSGALLTQNVQFAYNRMIQSNALAFSRYNISPTTTNWDGGANTGGNYWTLFTGATGNPSNGPVYGTSGSRERDAGRLRQPRATPPATSSTAIRSSPRISAAAARWSSPSRSRTPPSPPARAARCAGARRAAPTPTSSSTTRPRSRATSRAPAMRW